ncbi:MAG: hypothetical protein CL527_06545 [Aequorivita sp.]|nr:hypothetical protein [Aequorivita sp.]HAV53461.1 hypothetical protein [Aequorivita sp.]|tara:strand:- start:146 stop:1201 length:1056 start_codon:yes stop_codon:yes gene_type:complete
MKHLYLFAVLLLINLNSYAQATDFLTGLHQPTDILLHDNILYIAETNAGRIIKVDLSIPDPQPEVVINGIPVVAGLAIKGTELYFSQLNGQNSISKIELTDPNPTPTVILENFVTAHDIAFYGNELYIAQFGLDRIVKINPNIPNPPIVEVITNFETPIALELIGDELYIATYIQNKISKINLTSPNPAPIDVITNLSLPVGLEHRRNELYIAEAGQRIYEDRISKIDIRDSNPVRQTVVSGLYNPTRGLEIYEDVLYIAEDFKISSFGLPPLSTEEFNIENIITYPNPTPDYVKITGLKMPVNYRIYNTFGSILKQGLVADGEELNLKPLLKGMYILILDDTTVIKILKK